MSMNLSLEVEGKDFDLYQTPTAVTYSCFYKNGFQAFIIGFDKMKKDTNARILEKYCTWLLETSSPDKLEHIEKLMTIPVKKMRWRII